MAEAAQGGGDPVLMIRGMLDMTQPYQELQNLGRAAGEGTTFSNSGTPGTSSQTAVRERASRAIERQADIADSQQASFNIKNATPEAIAEGLARRNRSLDISQRMSANDWFYTQRARIAGMSGRWQSGVDVTAHGNDFEFSSGGGNDLSAFSSPSPEHEARLRAMRRVNAPHAPGYGPLSRGYRYLAEDHWQMRNPEYGPGDGPDANFNRARAEVQAEANAGVNEPHGPGYGPTAESNELRAGEQAAGATWARRNLPTLFGRGGNRGGMSVFYRRFLMLEALRGVSQLTESFANMGAGIAGTGGDPIAMAQFGIQSSNQMASSIPFVGGAISGLSNILSGIGNGGIGANTAVAQAALTVQTANQTMAGYASLGEGRFALSQNAALWAAPRGTLREATRIGQEETQTRREARERERTETGLAQDRAKSRHAEADAGHGFVDWLDTTIGAYAGAVIPGESFSKWAAGDEARADRYTAINQETASSRKMAAERRQADEQRASDIAHRQSSELWTDAGLDARASLTIGSTDAYQSSQTMMPNASNFNSLRFGQSQRRQQREFGYQQFVTQQENQMATERAKDPLLAPFRWVGHMGERALRRTQTDVGNAQDELQTSNQIGAGNQQYATATNVMTARFGRNPDAAITAQHTGDIAGIKFLPPEMQAGATATADAQRDLSQQQLQDSRSAVAGNLQLRRTVSAARANAYGLDSRAQLRGADVAQIAGSAELEAQGILRQDSTDKGKQMADSARQIGVNNLNAYAAEYSRGFRSVSKSFFEIAPGNQDSEQPGKVFDMVDKAVTSLKGNKGQIDVSGTKGSTADAVPQLLTQILSALTTGGALRVTE